MSVSAIMPGDSQEEAMKEKEAQFPDAICEPRSYQKIYGYFGRHGSFRDIPTTYFLAVAFFFK